MSLPHQVMRSDGQVRDLTMATLTWQVHPDSAHLLDDILDWYDTEAAHADRRVTVSAADGDALRRLAAHGFRVDDQAAGDDGFWTQFNRRDVRDLPEPALPPGFGFVTADQVTPEDAAQAHRDAWHPSTFTDRGMRGARETWPYRPGLHVLVRAPDGTLAATTIIWLDERTGTAEFEPVGTHQGYRRLGLARSLLRHGTQRAARAGATEMLVACLGAPAHTAARALYYDAGFRPFSREIPHVKDGAVLFVLGGASSISSADRLFAPGGRSVVDRPLVSRPRALDVVLLFEQAPEVEGGQGRYVRPARIDRPLERGPRIVEVTPPHEHVPEAEGGPRALTATAGVEDPLVRRYGPVEVTLLEEPPGPPQGPGHGPVDEIDGHHVRGDQHQDDAKQPASRPGARADQPPAPVITPSHSLRPNPGSDPDLTAFPAVDDGRQ
jgi:GNAT superfamily N-acetyltransferase